MVADLTVEVDPTFARGGPYLGRAAVGGPARPAVLLTGDETYDTRTHEELLLRAAETLLGLVGWQAERIQSEVATP